MIRTAGSIRLMGGASRTFIENREGNETGFEGYFNSIFRFTVPDFGNRLQVSVRKNRSARHHDVVNRLCGPRHQKNALSPFRA